MITVKASKHPLADDWVEAEVAPDQTIAEICGTKQVHVWLDGRVVPAEQFDSLRVRDGAFLVVRPVPAGDGVLNSILTLGAVFAAMALGGPVAGALGIASQFGINAVTAGITLALTTVVNALVPISMPDMAAGGQSFNRLAALTGTSNQVARFQPIPRLYGRHRFYPPIPMTALPFTEIEGSSQYLRMMLVLGYGPLDIGGVRVGGVADPVITEETVLSGIPITIGETDIHEYDGVEFEIGRPDQITLYSDQVIEIVPAWTTASDYSGIDPGSSGQWVYTGDNGASAVRTTEAGTDEISITVEGALFCVNSKGSTTWATIEWRIEYAPAGTGTWTVVFDPWSTGSVKRETARFSHRWKVARGQYDVRLTRIRTYCSDFEAVQDEMTWTALRSIKSNTPYNVPGTVAMAIRIKANDQLNGRLDNLAITATSVLPVWDGATWVEQTTRNPAWIYADIWTGTANRRPISKGRLDLDALAAWADDCDAKGFHYDRVLDDTGTTIDRAREVAACGRAAWNITPDAMVSVVRDTKQDVPKMIIGPRNSFGFQYSMRAAATPDALRVQFVDPNTWENTERLVFDDGYDENNAERYDSLQAKGVTDPDHAWKFGRYNLAQVKLRSETFSFSQDIQHLRYNRGDLLEYRHDVIAIGLADGRVKSVVTDVDGMVTGFVSDEFLPMPDIAKSYAIRIQKNDGSVETIALINETPGTNTPTLASPAVFSPGDYFLFGEAGREAVRVKVSAIEPEGDLRARITCVPEAPGIHDADSGWIPPYDPGITQPADPDRMPLPVPTITRIASDESVLVRDTDGSLRVRMLVETVVAAFPGWDGSRQLRYRPAVASGGEPLAWTITAPTTAEAVSLFDVDEEVSYEVQVRSVRGSRVSPWSVSQTHTVIGKSSPPRDVTGFTATAARDRILLAWNPVSDPDVGGYEIREGADWDTGVQVTTISGTSYQTSSPSNGPWWIKAFDTDTPANYSINPVQVTISPVLPVVFNLVAQVIDNNVRLQWSTTPGTFILDTHEIRRGDELAFSDLVGKSDKTFDIIQEIESGLYTYWVVPIDAAGNAGEAASVVVNVDEPPDFVLRNKFQTDWMGDYASVVPQLNLTIPDRLTTKDDPASALAPVIDRSRDQLVALGFNSRDDMIAAGYDYRVQPTPATARFVEEYDAGTVIASTSIRVTVASTAVVGAVASTITISVRENAADPWTTFPVGQNPVFATTFRYVKVVVDFSKDAADDVSFMQLNDVTTVLSTKLRNDTGIVNVTTNPTTVYFNVDFIDVEGIVVTPVGTGSLTAVVDFEDTQNPESFDIHLFDNSGNYTTGQVRWSCRGY